MGKVSGAECLAVLRVNLPRMEVASTSEATHAINFPAVMAIVAGIVADPKRFGVGVDQVSAVEPAGAEDDAIPIENTLDKIRSLQGKIQQVEVQAAIRQVQVKILEIKIRQVELMVLVRQAQQVVELKGKEASLMAKKRHLEQRIVDLDQKIRSIDSQPIELSVLQDLQLLLSQTETALASMNDAACEAVEDGVDDSSQPLAIEANSSQQNEETL